MGNHEKHEHQEALKRLEKTHVAKRQSEHDKSEGAIKNLAHQPIHNEIGDNNTNQYRKSGR